MFEIKVYAGVDERFGPNSFDNVVGTKIDVGFKMLDNGVLITCVPHPARVVNADVFRDGTYVILSLVI